MFVDHLRSIVQEYLIQQRVESNVPCKDELSINLAKLFFHHSNFSHSNDKMTTVVLDKKQLKNVALESMPIRLTSLMWH